MTENQQHHQVAKHLRDIVGIIGEDGRILIDGESFETGLDLPTQGCQVLDTADRIAQGNLQVVVIGVTCHGKTTLVNALVGAELLPIDTDVNTGAIVRIVHGEDTEAATLVEKGVSRTVSHSAFRDFIQIDAETQGSVLDEEPFSLSGHLPNLDYGILPHDNALTRRGIILVDTPGFDAGGKTAAVTEQFLAEADAVLVLLRAQPPITQIEVSLIRKHLVGFGISEKLENVFFVVNDFGDVDPASRKRIEEEILPRRLGPLFGNDEALFSERVFFVNAKAALEAQLSKAPEETLEVTDLSQLRQALVAIVDTGEYTRLALRSAISNLLVPAVRDAQKCLAGKKTFLEKDLQDLYTSTQTFTSKSEALAKEAERIRFVFETAIESIADKTAAHFENYVEGCFAAWSAAWEQARARGELKIGWFSVLFTTNKVRQARLRRFIELFFDKTFREWGEALFAHLAPDMKAMDKRLKVEVTDFFVDLDAALPGFIVEGDEIYNPRERSRGKGVQIVIGALTLDPNQLIATLRSDSWLLMLRHLVVDRLTAILVGIAVRASMKDRIGRVLSGKFQEVQPEIRQRIKAEIKKLLKPGTDRLDQSLQAAWIKVFGLILKRWNIS